jgi:hypothetical protein
MKQLLLIFAVSLCLASSLFGQIVTTIADVQDTTGGAGNGDSHLNGEIVTVEGIISAERGAFNGRYFIQDGLGPWSGVLVYGDWDRENAYGDSVRITATVEESSGLTRLNDVTEYVLLDSGKTVEPTLVSTGEIGTGGSNAEAYEGVLVQVTDVAITSPDLGYGEWGVDDGSGESMLDDYADYYFTQANYDSVRSITGVMDYSFGNAKIWPRLAWDIVEAGKFTRIQRIQQVRYSDLLKTPEDQMSDVSYAANPDNENMAGDTLSITGVVTMPSGLSYAGDGIKFILSEIGGGPWSSILSFNRDSTAYPQLFEGDVIEMTGYIGEYRTAPSNMTEFWITSPIDIIDFGQPVPDPDYVETGDLRLPITAEQWGNVLVYVKNAKVTNTTPQFELFEVDDGTGAVLIDSDSDSLNSYPTPTPGSLADSIRGWVYNHYGSYTDSNAYKLEPLYTSDIVWGVGLPPSLSNVQRAPQVPKSTDAVIVSADVATELTISTATMYYRVDGGAYTMLAMANTTGDTYTAEIPAQELGSWVDYCLVITDDQDQQVMAPADTSVQNLCYPVTGAGLHISDIQYTPWEIADSPFEGVNVTIAGMVTVDTLHLNGYDYFPIQEEDGAWNGMYVYADGMGLSLNKGDIVSVTGTITDYNSEWSFMFDNNTLLLAETVELLSTGATINSEVVTTGTLNKDSSDVVESYEGTMVEIQNATLVSINSYDITFDDGTGSCLVDDDAKFPDFIIEDDYVYAFGDTLREGDVVDMIKGSFVFSFGTYKIEIGGRSDMGSVVGIDSDFESVPLTYQLKQNFPNPFNPETRIYFQIPQTHNVTIAIYNMLGQKIRTLVKENFSAGHHVVNWDGQSDHGFQVPTGMYIYRIKAGDFVAAKKMVMIK